jgi:hypothetical protein
MPAKVKARAKSLDLTPRRSRKGEYLVYLDGEWRPSTSKRFHESVDPAARSTRLGLVPECTRDEVEEAVSAAERDFDAWRLVSGDLKTKVFYRLAEALKENESHLVGAMTREMGKTLFDSRLDYLEAVGVCEALAYALKQDSIAYVALPALGGLRRARKDSPNNGWRNESFRGYADYMQTEEFQTGLESLIDMSRQKRVAIMCAEAVPWRCHRSLVADALAIRDIPVIEILPEDRYRTHKLTPFARVENRQITYPPEQESLL